MNKRSVLLILIYTDFARIPYQTESAQIDAS